MSTENQGGISENQAEEFVKMEEESKQTPGSLGKVDIQKKNFEMPDHIGYIKVPVNDLPSQGLFYPEGTVILIRAATVAEIRHWSTIDETNYSNMDDVLNFIIEKCVKIQFPERPSSWKDIKDIDRFYLIFAVREFTFKNGENKLYVPGDGGKVEVTKDMISYFKLDDKIRNFYDAEKKCFIIRKGGKLNLKQDIYFHIPSIGVAQFIKNYIQSKQRNQQEFDESFIKYANFLFEDWRGLTHSQYEKAVSDSTVWSIEQISLYDKFTELLASGVDPKIVYTSGGTEREAPLNFSGGIKSLFIISDILDQLV